MYPRQLKSPCGERRSAFGKERYSALGVARELLFYGVEDFSRGFHAQIGGKKRRLDLFENSRVNLPAAPGDGIEGIGERVLGFANGFFQPLEQRRFGFAKESNHTCSRR